ncbi:MAG: hypothetical protein JWM89_3506 [Acidimicrobiales bacterium]|nr:hypothetical protein [Acidimicrobiales bacterium]
MVIKGQHKITPRRSYSVGGGPLYVGKGGWLLWQPEEHLHVHVRATRGRPGDHFAPVEVTIRSLDERRVTGTTMRNLPMGQLERALHDDEVDYALGNDRGAPVLDPGACSPAEAAVRTRQIHQDSIGWEDIELHLSVPARGKRADAFYAEVWRIHQAQSLKSRRPAADIAEANRVAISTVHGWLKEAKRRAAVQSPGPVGD